MGIRARFGLGLALVVAVLASASVVQAFDQTSAATYVQDTRAYVHGVAQAIPAIRKAGDALVARVRAHCAGLVPAQAKLTATSGAVAFVLGLESQFELSFADARPISSPAVNYAAALARLPWGNANLSRSLSTAVRDERAVGSIPKGPKLCKSIRAAVANGFARPPASAVRYIQRVSKLIARTNKDNQLSAKLSSQLHATVKQFGTPALQSQLKALNASLSRAQRQLKKITGHQSDALTKAIGAASS